MEYKPENCFIQNESRYNDLYTIKDKIQNDRIRQELQEIIESMKKDDVSQRQISLTAIGFRDDELNQNKPFSWNSSNQTDGKKDWLFFQHMIIYCILTKNTYLIRKWAVDYPFNQQNRLTVYTANTAKQYSNFVKQEILDQLPINEFDIEAEPYFRCLVEGLEKKNGSP